MKHYNDLDLLKNELQNAVIHPKIGYPGNAREGQVIYHLTNQMVCVCIDDTGDTTQSVAWRCFGGETDINGGVFITNIEPQDPNNNVADKVRIAEIDLREELPAIQVDVLMANLHHELLAALFRNQLFWQAQLYILSGFITGTEEKLLASLPASPPPFVERRRLDKWCLWVLGDTHRINR